MFLWIIHTFSWKEFSKKLDINFSIYEGEQDREFSKEKIFKNTIGIDTYPLSRLSDIPINLKIGYAYYKMNIKYERDEPNPTFSNQSKTTLHGVKVSIIGDIKISRRILYVHDAEYAYFRGATYYYSDEVFKSNEARTKIGYGGALSFLLHKKFRMILSPRMEFWDSEDFMRSETENPGFSRGWMSPSAVYLHF